MTQRYFREQGGPRSQDAVVVTLSASAGGAMAEVAWPGNSTTPGGDYLYPTGVPLALDRARDVMSHYGFVRIVVILPEGVGWNPAWGELVDLP